MPIDAKGITWDAPSGITWDSPEPLKADPTDGMSTAERLLAGIGRGMASTGRGVLQGLSMLTGANSVGAGLVKPEAIAEAKRLDAPLLNTTAGKVGNVVGMATAAAPTAFIPGANTYLGATLIGAGVGGAATEGDLAERGMGALFGGAGGAAGKAVGDGLGAGARWLADKYAQRAAAQAPRITLGQNASEAGYVIPPADLNPGMVTEALSGLSGKIKTAQAASQKNQEVTNSLAKKALGLDELSQESLLSLRRTAGTEGYAPIRAAGEVTASPEYGKALDAIASKYQGAGRSFPDAAKNPVIDLVEGLRQKKFDSGDAIDMIALLRENADKAFRAGDTGIAKANKAAATALENELETHLKSIGNPDALSAFKDARQAIAKSYTVQKALNQTTGDVNAATLAKELAKGRPLTNELLTIAQTAQAFPKATQLLKESPKAWSPLDFAVGAIGAGGSASPMGAALMAARPAIRAGLLSSPVQSLALRNPSPSLLSQMPANLLDQEITRRMFPGLLGIEAAALTSN